jgi:hypothetical protein
MNAWTTEELSEFEAAEELEIASVRLDGTLRKPTTVWVVRLADELFVRSVNGRGATWFRGTQGRHEGRISAGGITRDVTFADAGGDLDDGIDGAYRRKYGRYPAGIVGSVLTPRARAATIRLAPRSITS